jgi:ribonuclease Z
MFAGLTRQARKSATSPMRADTPANRQVIIDLVRGADLLFIEAAFAEADTGIAAERAHLTTSGVGEIARAAEARRVEPFHFSPRYQGEVREW